MPLFVGIAHKQISLVPGINLIVSLLLLCVKLSNQQSIISKVKAISLLSENKTVIDFYTVTVSSFNSHQHLTQTHAQFQNNIHVYYYTRCRVKRPLLNHKNFGHQMKKDTHCIPDCFNKSEPSVSST